MLVILSASPNTFHWNPAKKSKWVWSWDKIWAKVVVVHKPQSKFKANIARNAKFEGHLGLNFSQFGSEMAKN